MVIIAILLAIVFFYFVNRRVTRRRAKRKQRLDLMQERLLTSLREKSSKVPNDEVSDTTGDATKNKSW